MDRMNKTIEVGKEFSSKPKKYTEARVFAFSGGKFNSPGWPAQNIHTSLEFAKTIGLPTRAISATQYEGDLANLMIGLFGASWFTHGKMEAKFVAVVDVDDVITSRAVVLSNEKEGNAVRIKLDSWCENQHGQKVLVGSSSCLIE
jgi:acyl dehydratase